MSTENTVRSYFGKEWEQEVGILLTRHFGPECFYTVPAEDRGDLGIDGFHRNSGTVYQCYAPEGEPLKQSVRLGYQKGKIIKDIPKLAENDEKIEKIKSLTDGITIQQWVLITPIIRSKELQICANEEAEKLRNEGHIHISNTFSAIVQTDAFLEPERKALQGAFLSKINLKSSEPSSDEVIQWQCNTDNIEALSELIRKLNFAFEGASKEQIDRKITHYLKNYIRGKSILLELHKKHSKLHETIESQKRAFENLLETRSQVSMDTPRDRLLEELQKYDEELRSLLKDNIAPENISQLVNEAISDWLIRCPLDFDGA